eukprot:5460320-Prymnesium_polylepis.1
MTTLCSHSLQHVSCDERHTAQTTVHTSPWNARPERGSLSHTLTRLPLRSLTVRVTVVFRSSVALSPPGPHHPSAAAGRARAPTAPPPTPQKEGYLAPPLSLSRALLPRRRRRHR